MKKVYVAMSADIIHKGHINIIEKAREFGDVIVGVLNDEVISSYKRMPLLEYEDRKRIIENIKGVSEVVEQDALSYKANLMKIRPDFVIHGDDWKDGNQKEIREEVIEILKEWEGKLIEVPYTEGTSISILEDKLKEIGTTPEYRMRKLRRLLNTKKMVRVLEAHNGLTGLIVEKAKVEVGSETREYDAMWISSLCDSTAKGKPDIELVDFTSRLNTINDILEVTTKPIILDGDTGGKVEHFIYTVRSLERLGVSAIIIEDKVGLKKNSLFGTDVKQTQDTIENFSNKIRAGKKAQVTEDFMIIARIESLILKAGEEDALERAKAYIEAGADGIMIHSKEKSGEEVISFCKKYGEFDKKVPLVIVPTSYNSIVEDEFEKLGVNVVIYANHLIRSAFPSMINTAESILYNKRSLEASDNCMPIKEILELIPGGK